MHKYLRRAGLGLVALAVAVFPALAQEQQEQPGDLSKYAGVYEFEAPDYGVMEIGIAVTEEGGLTLSAMGNSTPLRHVSGHAFELNTPDFGVLNIGFVAEEDGSISALTIDSYDFSFIATKKKQ